MKPWYASKTFWVNTLTLLVGVITIFMGSTLMQDYIEHLVIGLAITNLFLRWLTTKPISSIVPAIDELRDPAIRK